MSFIGLFCHGATVTYNTTNGQLLYPTGFFNQHVIPGAGMITRYGSGSNTLTLLVLTNSISASGMLPPWVTNSVWFNGAWVNVTNIGLTSPTASTFTIAESLATNIWNNGIIVPTAGGGGNWSLEIGNEAIGTNKISLSFYNWLLSNFGGGGGTTNGFGVNGTFRTDWNFINSAHLAAATSGGTNWYLSLIDGSISTNKIDSTFRSWVLSMAGGGSGESNTASNLGTPSSTNQPFFKSKSGVDLQFRGLSVGPNLTLTSNANSVALDVVLSTNSGTTVSVDGGGSLSLVNISDSTGIGVTLSGTNATLALVDRDFGSVTVSGSGTSINYDTGSISSNHIAAGQVSQDKLGTSGAGTSTNFLAGDYAYKQVTTNMIPGLNAILATIGGSSFSASDSHTWTATNIFLGPTVIDDLTVTNLYAESLYFPFASAIVAVNSSSNAVPVTIGSGLLFSAGTLSATGGGVGGSSVFVLGSPKTNINLVSSVNGTVSASGSNVTYTFTGVGSATNGYLLKSSTTYSISNTVASTQIFTFSIPANTLSEDGDELILNIPGRYKAYTGIINGYTWHLNFDSDTVPQGLASGAYPSVLPSISSSFSANWETRIKRINSNTLSSITFHHIGADANNDITNVVDVVRFTKDATTLDPLGWGAAMEFEFILELASANVNHGFDIFGYTVVKVGSAGGSGGTFQPLDTDLTSLASGTVMSTAITNSSSIGAPLVYVGDSSYSASTWDSNTSVPTKNAVRDRLQTMAGTFGVNVKDSPYNATGDGTTDDTAALQAAFTASSVVFIPEGTYIFSASLYPTNGSGGIGTIYGVGPRSILKAAVTFTNGFGIDTGSNTMIIRDIALDGNNITNYVGLGSAGVRSGLRLWAGGFSQAIRVYAHNWSREGIFVEGIDNTTTRLNRSSVSFCSVTNSYRGIHMADTNKAEYCIVANNQVWKCELGLVISSANVTVTGNNVSDCGHGIYVYPLNGRGHSLFTGNTVNHSKVTVRNTTTGATFVGNHFMGGTTIYLTSPNTATVFAMNGFENTTVTDYGGTNQFLMNRVTVAFSQGGTQRSYYRDNFLTTGAKVSEMNIMNSTASITNDARFGGEWKITLTNNVSLLPPTQAFDGQKFSWQFLQDGTGEKTVTPTSGFAWSTNVPSINLSTNANSWSLLEGFYSTNTAKIHVTASHAKFL